MKDVKGATSVGMLMQVCVGIAMLQGARHEHAEALAVAANELDVQLKIVQLRTSTDVDTAISNEELDALVLPGGESTTMRIASDTHGLLMRIYNLLSKNSELPVLGTCAGAILLSNPDKNFKPFIDAEINRNSYGRQKESFHANLNINGLNIPEIKSGNNVRNVISNTNYQPLSISAKTVDGTSDSNSFQGIFIRAPRYGDTRTSTPVVFREEEVVGVQNNNMLGLTFHPELTNDRRFHRWLIGCAIKQGGV
jgi:5'-phosphate synthase pdxT subunit